MGLDMYLYRREYVSGWENTFISEKPGMTELYAAIADYFETGRCDGSPHMYVDICVAYWRKANAIHKWFCSLDEDKDECQKIYVTMDNLLELRDLCQRVFDDPSLAEELLPSQAGFFFGSTDYDDWYITDIKLTIDQIDRILKPIKSDYADFIYRASW